MQKRLIVLGAVLTLITVFLIPSFAVDWQVGDRIPELVTHSIEGVKVSFWPEEGRFLYLLFWDTNSWRASELAEWGLELNERYHSEGLDVIGVCTDTLDDEVLEFSETWKLPWPQVSNIELDTVELTEFFGVRETPGSVILGPEGKILALDLSVNEVNGALANLLDVDFVSSTIASFSTDSQYKGGWGPEQVTGAPDTPSAGDFASAWASLTPDDQEEWLLVKYETPVKPTRVDIYESFNPGAVYKVSAITPDNEELELWRGTDPTPAEKGNGISSIPVTADCEINQIKIYLNSKDFPGWNQIDAVGLIDQEEAAQWAVDAKASSSFSRDIQFGASKKSYLYPTKRSLVSFDQLREVERAVEEMKQSVGADADESRGSFRYHIQAYIEGASVLVLHRNTARWYHVDTPLDGFELEDDYPTYVNGVEWFPQWSDGEKGGWSSINSQIEPALPAADMEIELTDPQVKAIHCNCEMDDKALAFSDIIGQAPKGRVYLLQSPTQENNYVMAIAFDDFGLGGSNLYECFVNVRAGKGHDGADQYASVNFHSIQR